MNDQRAAEAKHVTWIGFWVNVFLTLIKFMAGITGRSSAMVADAVHSLSDSVTDVIVIFSFRIVGKPKDATHDYGHGKFETLASNFVGVTLLVIGIGIFLTGLQKIVLSIQGERIAEPGWIAFIAAVLSILIKELLYRYQIKVGNKINSQAIIANAWHHRSDAFSSIAAMAGIGGAILLGEKWLILDPIAAVMVSILIVKVSLPIIWESIQELLEVSLGEKEESKIIEIVSSISGAEDPHNLRTRKIGNYFAVDIHIRVDSSMNVVQAHDIATEVEKKLKAFLGEESTVYVHIEPQ